LHYYLATSRAQKEKQEPNGVLAHQAALAFPFVCGASRKPRKAFGFPRCPATGANPQKNKSPQLCFKQKQLIIIKKQPYPPLHKPIPKSTHQENEQNSNRKEHILHGTK
jgi:hypothetical protein